MTGAPQTDTQMQRLDCLELRGGNSQATFPADLPGLACWVSCNPLRPSTRGGDLYFLTACSQRRIARIVLADVSGHGEIVSAAADDLRHVLRLHIDDSDQSRLVQEINDSFLNDEHRIRYATGLLLTFASCSGELFFTNAGHLPPLHYRASHAEWRFLHEATEGSGKIADLPLGLMPGMPYHQTGLQLDPGDLLVLYTDGINEAQNESAQQLGLDGLLSTVQGLPAHSVAAAGGELLARVAEFRGSALPQDDVTVVVLMRVHAH